MKKNLSRGFTLIELLVVIAIIGILASVVLASLNSARNKGADAATKSQLASARAQAELFYDNQNPNSYANICTAANGVGPLWAAVNNSGGTNGLCNSNATSWYMVGRLKAGTTNSTDGYCVDATGTTKTGNAGALANNSTFACN